MFWSKKHREFLRTLPLLADFSDGEIEQLADLTKERAFAPKEALFAADDTGGSAFIVYEGRIKVLIPERSGRIREVATVEKGAIIGQVAFLDGGERSASCVADSGGATVLEIAPGPFQAACDKAKPSALKFLDVLTVVLVGQFRSANNRLAAAIRRESGAAAPRTGSHPDIQALFADITGSFTATGMEDVSAFRQTIRLE